MSFATILMLVLALQACYHGDVTPGIQSGSPLEEDSVVPICSKLRRVSSVSDVSEEFSPGESITPKNIYNTQESHSSYIFPCTQHFSLPQFSASAAVFTSRPYVFYFYMTFISSTPLLRILYSWSKHKRIRRVLEGRNGHAVAIRDCLGVVSAGSLCPRHGAACYL